MDLKLLRAKTGISAIANSGVLTNENRSLSSCGSHCLRASRRTHSHSENTWDEIFPRPAINNFAELSLNGKFIPAFLPPERAECGARATVFFSCAEEKQFLCLLHILLRIIVLFLRGSFLRKIDLNADECNESGFLPG